MPHLSPLSWKLIPIVTLVMIISLTMMKWWHQLLSFPNYSSNKSPLMMKWNWKY